MFPRKSRIVEFLSLAVNKEEKIIVKKEIKSKHLIFIFSPNICSTRHFLSVQFGFNKYESFFQWRKISQARAGKIQFSTSAS